MGRSKKKDRSFKKPKSGPPTDAGSGNPGPSCTSSHFQPPQLRPDPVSLTSKLINFASAKKNNGSLLIKDIHENAIESNDRNSGIDVTKIKWPDLKKKDGNDVPVIKGVVVKSDTITNTAVGEWGKASSSSMS